MRPLDDHDPMHDRREAMSAWERELRPKRERHWALWLAMAVVLVFLLYCGAEWLLSTQRAAGKPDGSSALQPPSPPAVEETTPAPPATAPSAVAPDTFEVTKCLTPSGKAAYSDGPCPEGSRATTVRLRRDMNLADGMSVAQREASNRNSAAMAAQQRAYELQVAQNVDNAMAECSRLEAYVGQLDAIARQPQGTYSQDRLRSERQAARDQQFRLHCR